MGTDVANKTPFLYDSIHDNNNPSVGFRNSDLKQSFMTRQQRQARMIAPTIPIPNNF
jgi:hypothetical protein